MFDPCCMRQPVFHEHLFRYFKGDNSSIKMSAQSIIAQMETGDYRDGEVLVRFKSGNQDRIVCRRA